MVRDRLYDLGGSMTKKNKKKEEKLYMLHDDRIQLTPEQKALVQKHVDAERAAGFDVVKFVDEKMKG